MVVHYPDLFSGSGVEGDQPAIQTADVDLAVVNSNPTIHHIAAGATAPFPWHPGIVVPDGFTGVCFDRMYPAPGAGKKHDAIHDDGRGFLSSVGAHVLIKGQTQIGDVFPVDLGQRRKALFFIGAAVGQPVTGFGVRIVDPGIVDQTDGRCRPSGFNCWSRFLGGYCFRFFCRLSGKIKIGQNGQDGRENTDDCAHAPPPHDRCGPIITLLTGRSPEIAI